MGKRCSISPVSAAALLLAAVLGPPACGNSSSTSSAAPLITPDEKLGCASYCQVMVCQSKLSSADLEQCTAQCLQSIPAQAGACRYAYAGLVACQSDGGCSGVKLAACQSALTRQAAACSDAGVPAEAGSDSGESGSDSSTPACRDYKFVADGKPCSQCGFDCQCAASKYPVLIDACTPDGCIVSADCKVVCGASDQVTSCTHDYTIQSSADGGGGSAGSGGTSGTDAGTDASGGTSGTDAGTDASGGTSGTDAGTDA